MQFFQVQFAAVQSRLLGRSALRSMTCRSVVCCAWPREVEVGYLTDVEGSLDYFERWVQLSGVLHFDQQGALQLSHSKAHFVYGGDVVDRGPGDIRLTKLLVDRAWPPDPAASARC